MKEYQFFYIIATLLLINYNIHPTVNSAIGFLVVLVVALVAQISYLLQKVEPKSEADNPKE